MIFRLRVKTYLQNKYLSKVHSHLLCCVNKLACYGFSRDMLTCPGIKLHLWEIGISTNVITEICEGVNKI